MSSIEETLRDLRTALGDRLSPSVSEAKLREARGHLMMAKEELGEAEAIRRFGPTRRVAGEIVRAQRGYPSQSSFRLSFGIGATLAVAQILQLLCGWFLRLHPHASRAVLINFRWVFALMVLLFFVRVLQTRRWLTFAMVAWQVGTLITSVIIAPWWLYGDLTRVVLVVGFYSLIFTTVWAVLNALALGVGAVDDRRRVARG